MIINIDNIMNSLDYVFFDFCAKNGFCVWLIFAYNRPALSSSLAKCVARLCKLCNIERCVRCIYNHDPEILTPCKVLLQTC